MSPVDLLLAGLVVAFIGWRLFTFARNRKRIPALLEAGAQVIDVRTPGEFAAGHAKGSVNIPLDEIERGAKKLDRSRPVIAVCASGTRSGIACRKLQGMGFTEVLNGGSWRHLA